MTDGYQTYESSVFYIEVFFVPENIYAYLAQNITGQEYTV